MAASGMARFLLSLTVGLILGLLAAWWWLGGGTRPLAQSGERLLAWTEVSSAEALPVDAGGKPWIVGCTVHLRSLTGASAAVNVPAQRFLVVRGNGQIATGHLAEGTTARVGDKLAAPVLLPNVNFVSSSQDVASVILAIDEGDGLRLIAAPVGKAPAQPEAAKPSVEKAVEKK